MKNLTISLEFLSEKNKKLRLKIDNVKENFSKEDVLNLKNFIIEKKALSLKEDLIKEYSGAYLIETNTTPIDI